MCKGYLWKLTIGTDLSPNFYKRETEINWKKFWNKETYGVQPVLGTNQTFSWYNQGKKNTTDETRTRTLR